METTDIRFEKRDHVALATFQRPEALNALRQAALRDFITILDEVEADPAVRVLVLTGTGRAFSAGIDLKEIGQNAEQAPALKQIYADLQTTQDVTRRMVRMPKVILSAVNGLAVGIGVEVALASDIRLAAESATFTFAEVKRALFETNGVMYILPRLVGMGRALHMLLTGETIAAQEALAAGLVTRVAPGEQLLDLALATARTIAANAPLSVRLVKQVMQRTYDLDLEAVMQLEVDGMLQCYSSDDLLEGIKSFVEKRPPSYQGR
ncbi:MAG TPA: enoyl-CoA hydratase/isomerase family protein [Ktedonobacterales bacterium]